MGGAGSPHGKFQKALATRNPLIATSAAHELGRLSLSDSLGLLLLYRDRDPERYERAAVRWHALFCFDARNNLAREDTHLALAALLALGGPRPDAGGRALLALLDGLVMTTEARVMGVAKPTSG